MTPTPRARLDALLELYTGIEVARGGISANIDQYLTRRLPELGMTEVEDYLSRLGPTSAELERLLNAITVTHTWFMRDPGQLAIIEELLKESPSAGKMRRIWVPGCATGEDVYSIAMLAERAGKSVDVLGTDLNSLALRYAERGCYGAWSVRDVHPRENYFTNETSQQFSVHSRLRKSTRFSRHNLVDAPEPGPWDVILCRNVLIYLARDKARTVFERLADVLAPEGHLILGASEVVFDVPPELEARYIAGRLAFKRLAAQRPGAPPVERRRAPSLIPRAPREAWHSPMAAVPSSAASIVPSARPANPNKGPEYALLERGHAQLDAGALDAALLDYRAAIELEPAHAEPHLYAGVALYLAGELDQALHELRAAAFLDSQLWPASLYLALCHETLGHLEEAVREYRHVVRLAAAEPKTQSERRHSAWHADLLELARRRARSEAHSITLER
ncbi:MAG TPA: CheR family methyltransferase [Polyangiaceae bacterium]|jgi:chemotaxis protein methyltransferase CheR|nr:CheR family methyltransferase [Polyangiaceae bacterium]